MLRLPQASNKDLQNLFGAYGIEWVEWCVNMLGGGCWVMLRLPHPPPPPSLDCRLNGQCVNVLFKNAKDAERAMSDISEPIPVVQGAYVSPSLACHLSRCLGQTVHRCRMA